MPTCSGSARGSLGKVLIDFEDTFGVDPVTIAATSLPFLSEDLDASRAQNQSAILTGSRNAARPFGGNLDVGGSITVPMDVNNIGYWFKLLIGQPVTSGAGPYTHTFKIDSAVCLPSAVIEVGFPDVPFYKKFNGMKANSISVQQGGDGEYTATFNLIGTTMTEDTTTMDASPTVHSLVNFRQFDTSLKEGGVTFTKGTNLSLDLSNNLDGGLYTIGGGGTRTAIPEGTFSGSGQLTYLFDTTGIVTKAIASTETSIEVIATRGSESLSIDLNEVEFGLSLPKIAGPAGVTHQISFSSYYDNDAAASQVVITLVNSIASY
jgi:hypothetical protein